MLRSSRHLLVTEEPVWSARTPALLSLVVERTDDKPITDDLTCQVVRLSNVRITSEMEL